MDCLGILRTVSSGPPVARRGRMRELRYAIRQLVRTPAFTVVAVLTLALGMGANTAFFSVLHGVMLQQPPYPAADRLVALHNVKDGRVDNGGMLSRAEVREYRRAPAGLRVDRGRRPRAHDARRSWRWRELR